MSFVRTFCQIYYYFHTQEPLFYSPTFITPTLRTPCDHQHLASQRVKTFFIFVNKTHLSIVYILTLTATIFDLSLFILPSRRFAIAGQLPHLYLATPLAVTPSESRRYFWLKARSTLATMSKQHKNISGVGFCILVSAGFYYV